MSIETTLWKLVGVNYGQDFCRVGNPCYIGIHIMQAAEPPLTRLEYCRVLLAQNSAFSHGQVAAIADFYFSNRGKALHEYEWVEQLDLLRDFLKGLEDAAIDAK